jgi:hypothetical protein
MEAFCLCCDAVSIINGAASRTVIDTSENKDGILNYLDGCPGLPMQKSGLEEEGKARKKNKRKNVI